MFDLDELRQLKEIGVRRVRYADGAELELDPYFGMPKDRDVIGLGALAKQEIPWQGTSPIEQMPSRAELRRELEKLLPDGAEPPAVAP